MQPHRIAWIEHGCRQILVEDWSGLEGDELAAVVALCREYVLDLGKTDLLILIDARNTRTNRRALAEMRENARKMSPLIKRDAVVGIQPMQRLVLNAINLLMQRPIRAFQSMDAAKDWLADADGDDG